MLNVDDFRSNKLLPRLRYLLLDFRLVSGYDSSAVSMFERLQQLAEIDQFRLVLTNLPLATREDRILSDAGQAERLPDNVNLLKALL